jgi:hypothetical protein
MLETKGGTREDTETRLRSREAPDVEVAIVFPVDEGHPATKRLHRTLLIGDLDNRAPALVLGSLLDHELIDLFAVGRDLTDRQGRAVDVGDGK